MKATEIAIIAGVAAGAVLLLRQSQAKGESEGGGSQTFLPNITFPTINLPAFNLGAPNVSIQTTPQPSLQAPGGPSQADIVSQFGQMLKDALVGLVPASGPTAPTTPSTPSKTIIDLVPKKIQEIVSGTTIDEITKFVPNSVGKLGGKLELDKIIEQVENVVTGSLGNIVNIVNPPGPIRTVLNTPVGEKVSTGWEWWRNTTPLPVKSTSPVGIAENIAGPIIKGVDDTLGRLWQMVKIGEKLT